MSELISELEFDEVWCPVLRPSGDLLQFADVRDEPVQHVWTIVESGDDADGSWYAAPGFHIVNNIGYVMTKSHGLTSREMRSIFSMTSMTMTMTNAESGRR